MASNADAAAELVLLHQAADSNLYWTSRAFALLFYDYILTLRHEVRFVWGRKFSAATTLFLVNRYFIILLYLVDVVTLFPISTEASPLCPGIGRFITVLEVIPYIIWATFSALRAYALSSRTAAIGITIFVLSLVPAGVNAYFFSTFTFINLDPPSNCTALSDITPDLSKTLTIVSRAALMAADVMVIAVTWANTYRLGKASHDARVGGSFSGLLLRDGTIYFVVLIAMNIVHMTLNTVKPNNIVQQASYVTILENPITSILISRFILNLRAVDHRGADGGRASDTLFSSAGAGSSFAVAHPNPRGAASTMRFASVVSTVDVLGAPLGCGVEGDDEDEDAGWGGDAEKACVSVHGDEAVELRGGGVPMQEGRRGLLSLGVQSLRARDPGSVPGRSAEAGSSAM